MVHCAMAPIHDKLLSVLLIMENFRFAATCFGQHSPGRAPLGPKSDDANSVCGDGWGIVKHWTAAVDATRDQWNNDWTAITAPTGKWNNELQRYENSDRTVFFKRGSGTLNLRAVRDGQGFTSGRFESKDRFTPLQAPGKKLRIEFTGKVPTVMGAWPAYWLLGNEIKGTPYEIWPGLGEIDVMEWAEQFRGQYLATIHWKGDNRQSPADGHRWREHRFSLPAEEMVNNGITYGVEISAAENDQYIEFYRRRPSDRAPRATSGKIDRATWNDWTGCDKSGGAGVGHAFAGICTPFAPFDNKMRLIINLAVGGDFGGKGVTNYNAFNGGVEFETESVLVCQKL